MLGVMSAKWVADAITHSLYHAIIEAKCLPFLNPEVTLHGVSDGELEKHSISALLKVIGESAGTVRTLRAGDVETFGSIAQCLSDSAHGCYPLIDKDKHFVGTVSRAHLASILVAASKGTADRLLTYEELLDDAHLLTHLDIDVALDAVRGGEARGAGDRMHGKRVTRLLPRPFISPPPPLASTAHLRSCSPLTPPTSTAHVHRSPPPLTSSSHPSQGSSILEALSSTYIRTCTPAYIQVMSDAALSSTRVDLGPYMNASAMSLRQDFSLHRAYMVFRTMGLRVACPYPCPSPSTAPTFHLGLGPCIRPHAYASASALMPPTPPPPRASVSATALMPPPRLVSQGQR